MDWGSLMDCQGAQEEPEGPGNIETTGGVPPSFSFLGSPSILPRLLKAFVGCDVSQSEKKLDFLKKYSSRAF